MSVADMLMRRMTVGDLQTLFSIECADDARAVTITDLACASKEIKPGCLYIPPAAERDEEHLRDAVTSGCYAILLPQVWRGRASTDDLGIPVLFSDEIDKKLGLITAHLYGEPSQQLAIFVVYGMRCHSVARKLSDILHMLGNPVGTVVEGSSLSLSRELEVPYPLNAVHLQQQMQIMVEDGATAAVMAADEATLAPWALVGTAIDVVSGQDSVTQLYGATFSEETHVAAASERQITQVLVQSDGANVRDEAARQAVSMALAAGITPDSISQAAWVSQELN